MGNVLFRTAIMLLTVSLIVTGGIGGIHEAAANPVSLNAKMVDGEVYVNASDLLQSFGGTGTYDAKNNTYGYKQNDPIQFAIEHISPSVVAIIGRPDGGDDTGETDRFELSHGTGVVVGTDGWIMTNAHVVKNMDGIVVVTSDGKQFSGKMIHSDEESDLALVRINALGLIPAQFAVQQNVRVGETVIAVGTPISFSLRNSVTVGVISGMNRSVHSTYQLLQTDAAINPGNSGGPLVNLKGEIVGINSLKFVDIGIDSLGFAIPADTVQYVLDHFWTYGKVVRPYTGFDLEESWAAVVGLPTDEPLTILWVEAGSGAAAAGIRQGDVLHAIDGMAVSTIVEYNEALKRYLPGDKAVLLITSGEKTESKQITFTDDPYAGNITSTGNGVHSIDASTNDNRLDMWFQVGNSGMIVNGEELSLAAPYTINNAAAVPLKSFIAGIGADLEWDAVQRSATLFYNEHVLEFRLGDLEAKFDEQLLRLPFAPEERNGNMMVPLRFMTDTLGVALKYYAKTAEIVVSGTIDGDGSGFGINGDTGMSQIGDSFYDWSMNYPSGLIKSYQTTQGDYVYFSDARGDYDLTISIRKTDDESLTNDELLKLLSNEGYRNDVVLDRRYVEEEGRSYARILSKDSYGSYSEYRGFYNDGKIYVVTMEIYSESNFNNPSKANAYKILLDSFDTSFDSNDNNLKNISMITEGMRDYRNADYGLTLKIPAGWSVVSGSSNTLMFRNDKKNSEYLSVRVTSIREGDLLEAWAERHEERIVATFLPEYLEVDGIRSASVSGITALKNSFSYQLKEDRNKEQYVYLFSGNYKYEFKFSSMQNSDEAETNLLVDAMMASIIIEPNKLIGTLDDELDVADLSKTVTKKSNSYKYEIDIPEFWQSEFAYDDGGSMSYNFTGGSFWIDTIPDTSINKIIEFMEETLKAGGSDDAVQINDVIFAGVPARKIVEEQTEEGTIHVGYAFEKDGNSFMISYELAKEVSTEQTLKRLADTVESFRFIQ